MSQVGVTWSEEGGIYLQEGVTCSLKGIIWSQACVRWSFEGSLRKVSEVLGKVLDIPIRRHAWYLQDV